MCPCVSLVDRGCPLPLMVTAEQELRMDTPLQGLMDCRLSKCVTERPSPPAEHTLSADQRSRKVNM